MGDTTLKKNHLLTTLGLSCGTQELLVADYVI